MLTFAAALFLKGCAATSVDLECMTEIELLAIVKYELYFCSITFQLLALCSTKVKTEMIMVEVEFWLGKTKHLYTAAGKAMKPDSDFPPPYPELIEKLSSS